MEPKILIVDDEAHIRLLLEQTLEDLEDEGVEVLVASNGEELVCWQAHDVDVAKLPDDEQGIIRISIGGGDATPVQLNYCRFRGDHGACVDLLRKVLRAMEAGGE